MSAVIVHATAGGNTNRARESWHEGATMAPPQAPVVRAGVVALRVGTAEAVEAEEALEAVGGGLEMYGSTRNKDVTSGRVS